MPITGSKLLHSFKENESMKLERGKFKNRVGLINEKALSDNVKISGITLASGMLKPIEMLIIIFSISSLGI